MDGQLPYLVYGLDSWFTIDVRWKVINSEIEGDKSVKVAAINPWKVVHKHV